MKSFLDGRVILHEGDCRNILKTIPDCSIDSIVCDPPYHLTSIVKRFAKVNQKDVDRNFVDRKIDGQGTSPFARSARGFMGKQWDGGDIAFQPELWAEVLRVLKPGGYIMAFSGCRTYHRMACAIEDAGFITHPFFAWAFGSGFPKAHNVSKQIDKRGGKPVSWFGPWLRKWRGERGVTQKQIAELFPSKTGALTGCVANWELGYNLPTNEQFNLICKTFEFPFENMEEAERGVIGNINGTLLAVAPGQNNDRSAITLDITVPSTDAAREWDGWFYGTQSVKPSFEPIFCGSKPFSDCTQTQDMVEFSIILEALLWSIASVKTVEYISMNSRVDQGGSVRWIVLINRVLSSGGTSELMATFNLPEAASIFLSIVLLWNAILDASSLNTSTSTMKMETGLTIGLKTLKSWILAIIPENIIKAAIYQNGVWLIAQDVEPRLGASLVFSPSIQPLSVVASATVNSTRQILSTLADIAVESSLLPPALVGDIVRDPARIVPERKSVNLEPIYFGQKPFERGLNGAQNVMKWGVGAVNVGGCKIPSRESVARPYGKNTFGLINDDGWTPKLGQSPEGTSRWPANFIHDGSDEVMACFPENGRSSGGHGEASKKSALGGNVYGEYSHDILGKNAGGVGDSGSAARFFYTAKADADDRLGSKHPTVKPLDLIQYLVRLITPKNGVCLDLFAGTGTTGEACFREGFRAILIEREAEYIGDIERRMSLVMEGPVTRTNAGMKARGRPRDDGPLFGGSDDSGERFVGSDGVSRSRAKPLPNAREYESSKTFGGKTLEQVAAKIAELGEELGFPEDTRITLIPDEAAE